MMFEKIKRIIAQVPRGRVATYGQIAKLAGYPGAARQVAWALHNSSGLPWHRIIGAGGKISLTGDPGFEQRIRLQTEGVQFHGLRVDIKNHAWVPAKRSKVKTKTRSKINGTKSRRRS
jgi:methylated-DNA-protein-cysteine methyltransferase-like protein